MSIAQNFPNIKPSLMLSFADTRQLDNRVTFTRSTPAVYYDGKTTAMAEQNLLIYSQQFDNAAWSKYNASITADTTTAPDGTSTADTFTPSGSNPLAYELSPSAGTFTFSVYAKALVDTSITLACTTGFTGVAVQFNLSAGTAGSVTSYSGGANATITGGTASIVSVGNGWYRCILANVTVTESRAFHFGSGGTNGTYTGTIYAWGAQLEQRSSATAYTPTTTQPITNYIPVLLTAGGNQPRFDCNPTTGESLGLLIEEQRTNLSLYSAFFQPNWTKDYSSVTANSVVAPDGTLNAATLVEDTTTNFHLTYPAGISSTAATYTASVYLKQAGRRYAAIQIYTDGASNRYTILVDLSNGTFIASNNVGSPTNTGYAITSVGNGWYRISVTATQNTTNLLGIAVGASDSATPSYTSGFPVYTGNNWNAIHFWGAQLEAGSCATSYIPTTSASATRTADVASMTGANFSSWFNNSQGTFVAIVDAGNLSNGARVLKVSDSDSNRLLDFYVNGTSQAVYSYQNSITSANYNAGTISTSKYLTAVSYATGNISGLVNGGSVTTSTSAVVSSVANSTFAIGYDPISGGSQLSRPIAKIAYYPIQVTSANLQALTS